MGQGQEAAASVPGIEKVTAKTDKITRADTAGMSDLQEKFQRAADQAKDSHRAIVGTLEGLPAAWSGTA
ncbi:MAG: hypothetical protein ACRDQ1_13585, partial [Sciscionella sp.]